MFLFIWMIAVEQPETTLKTQHISNSIFRKSKWWSIIWTDNCSNYQNWRNTLKGKAGG